MQPDDVLEVEILEDGTIKISTNKVSAANHQGAEEMLRFIARLAGGATTITKKSKHSHAHAHEHAENKG